LGALGGAEATESLLLACLDEHESVRVAARAALGEIHGEPPPESIDLLRAELGL
jgi:HEAT repeat protein